MKIKKVYWILGIFILITAGVGYYFFGASGTKFKTSFIKIGEVGFEVEVADTLGARMKGLSGREVLGENEGMLFVFSSSGDQGFWMKDMKFSIDIVWIQDDEIVGFEENVQPVEGKSVFGLKIYHPPEPVNKVLEVKAGMVKKYGFQAGDIIVIQ